MLVHIVHFLYLFIKKNKKKMYIYFNSCGDRFRQTAAVRGIKRVAEGVGVSTWVGRVGDLCY